MYVAVLVIIVPVGRRDRSSSSAVFSHSQTESGIAVRKVGSLYTVIMPSQELNQSKDVKMAG